MIKRESTLSLTIMVIIMALLAIFVGYLLGNWIIQMLTGDNPDVHQVVQEKIIQEEIIGKNEDIPDKDFSSESLNYDLTENFESQLSGDVFVVQVGAFNEYSNALSLKEELISKGFHPQVTEGIPYKVQLGASTERQEVELVKKKLESFGYEAFITH
jgi:hypothetical protein